jgi:hypothetical protein
MSNHEFTPIMGMEHKCAVCQHNANTHGACECCPNNDHLVKFKTMMMCPDCYNKEKSLTQLSEATANDRLDAERIRSTEVIKVNEVLQEARLVDDGIQIRTDIFNAETVAINDLKSAIMADSSIENKPYALAEELKRRFEHYKTVVFDLNQKVAEVGNQQKAIQVYLNTMANTLRAEERERLKIADINYTPKPVKLISDKPKSIKTRSAAKVLDKDALKAAAKQLGVSEFMIQMLVVSKGITIDMAVKQIAASLEAAKQATIE